MSLPGLGIFTLDKSVVLPEEHDRSLVSMPNAVQFQNANIPSADKELINFICEHTGKIRPLAISDLDSYLNLGTEMLNIGKPFYLEGIGTITKNKSGKFDFSPGEYALIREHEDSHEPGSKRVQSREKKQITNPTPAPNRNLMKILAFAGAVVIVAVGGWLMYKKNNPAATEQSSTPSSGSSENQLPASDTSANAAAKKDSAQIRRTEPVNSAVAKGQEPVNYKFIILSTYNKPHALRRYNQLLGFDLKIHLYQKDSSFFKVYFQFPAFSHDTTHIKDSLRREYDHEVIIEP
jgi:hypothetical protein